MPSAGTTDAASFTPTTNNSTNDIEYTTYTKNEGVTTINPTVVDSPKTTTATPTTAATASVGPTTAEPTTGIHHYTNSTATSKRDHDSTSLPTVVWSTNTSTNLVTDGTAGPSTPIPTTADLITVSPTTIDVTPAAPTKASTAASPTTVQLITPAPTVAATTTRTSTTNTPGNIWSTTTQASYIFY